MLALLIALAAALYAVTWLLAGPPGDREVPTVPAVEVSHPAHPLGPELLAGLHGARSRVYPPVFPGATGATT